MPTLLSPHALTLAPTTVKRYAPCIAHWLRFHEFVLGGAEHVLTFRTDDVLSFFLELAEPRLLPNYTWKQCLTLSPVWLGRAVRPNGHGKVSLSLHYRALRAWSGETIEVDARSRGIFLRDAAKLVLENEAHFDRLRVMLRAHGVNL